MMAQSKREQIIIQIVESLKTIFGGAVYRSPRTALTKNKTPCCVVTWVGETVQEVMGGYDDVSITLDVTIFFTGSDTETNADAHAVEAHAAIMDDRTLGGLALDTHRVTADRSENNGDTELTAITHRYACRYRNQSNDLTT